MKIAMVACGDAFTVAIGAGDRLVGTMGADRGVGRPVGSGGYPAQGCPTSIWGQDGIQEGGCLLSCVPLFPSLRFSLAEGEVYSWGKGARGRLGRRDEDAGLPRPVQLDETHPYTVTSVSCCHGNTLLAVRREL